MALTTTRDRAQRRCWNRCVVTARQIRRDLQETCGTELPDDDAGRDNAALMVRYLAHVPDGPLKAENFLALWCPWMAQPERELMLRDAALSPPPRLTADQLAVRLGTTYTRRQKLRHTVIGAIDVPKEERARLRKERDRERSRRRKERQRRDTGRRTRQQYLATALSATKPWEAEGVSRRTWYRRRASGTLPPSVAQVGTAASLCIAARTTCATPPADRA
jgi:hypothetical protein